MAFCDLVNFFNGTWIPVNVCCENRCGGRCDGRFYQIRIYIQRFRVDIDEYRFAIVPDDDVRSSAIREGGRNYFPFNFERFKGYLEHDRTGTAIIKVLSSGISLELIFEFLQQGTVIGQMNAFPDLIDIF